MLSFPRRIISSVTSIGSTHRAHRCSFHPDRRDLYVRLGTATVFVRDQDRSLQFYVDQLGFGLALDKRLPSGDRWLTVEPPDGTAMLSLVSPKPDSEEYNLIGRSTHIVFLTENVLTKFEEWRGRGVHFLNSPGLAPWGEMAASFEDPDGNSFTLLCSSEVIEEVETQKRAHAERLESELRNAQELERARDVQAKLFPQLQPPIPTLEYTGVCFQALQVGGDYYDFLDLGSERVALVIGDIAGKGMPAALLMANLQAHLRNQCATYSSRPFTPFALEQPQRFLLSVNRLFCENMTEAAYATLFFAEYDDRNRRLRYVNCGHPPGILLRQNDEVERLDSTSTVVGLFKQWDCDVGERHLSPGDTLVLYTDGVTESLNADGEEFGEERLIERLRQCRHMPPAVLISCLVEDVRQFSPNEQRDDITLLIARCRRE